MKQVAKKSSDPVIKGVMKPTKPVMNGVKKPTKAVMKEVKKAPGVGRLGPPPQLCSMKLPQQQLVGKVEPKLRQLASKHVKLVARWLHTSCSWKQVLMTWMVLLIASKMVLLALTAQFFTLTSLVSLQIFHGVWTLSFLCLTVLECRARLLPNASCLLAGYLPATTVLHILLIPSDYPLPFIISDASTTLLAIVTMFALLRMECTQILAEAEQMWQQPDSPVSEAGTNSTGLSSGSPSPRVQRVVLAPVQATIASPQYQQHPSMDARERREIHSNNQGYEEAIDLEPIDFEHFLDEPDLERSHHLEKMFRVTYGEGPARGR